MTLCKKNVDLQRLVQSGVLCKKKKNKKKMGAAFVTIFYKGVGAARLNKKKGRDVRGVICKKVSRPL